MGISGTQGARSANLSREAPPARSSRWSRVIVETVKGGVAGAALAAGAALGSAAASFAAHAGHPALVKPLLGGGVALDAVGTGLFLAYRRSPPSTPGSAFFNGLFLGGLYGFALTVPPYLLFGPLGYPLVIGAGAVLGALARGSGALKSL